MTSQNRAAWLTSKQAYPFKVDDAPMPTPEPNEVVIRIHAVAINPTDWGIQALGILIPEYPAIVGFDIAGKVVAMGSDVKTFKAGDRVLSVINKGGFQLFGAADHRLTAKLPDNITYTQGCVLPLAMSTAASSLFEKQTLALPFPSLEPKAQDKVVLVWGGSSSVGSCGIQMLKAAGFEVAATAGAHNETYCRDLGVDHFFDHKKESVVDDIVTTLKGRPFAGVFDAIITPETILKCAIIADRLGKTKESRLVATVLPPPGTGGVEIPLPEGIPEGVRTCPVWGDALRNTDVGPAIWGRWITPALANGSLKCKPDPEVVGQGLQYAQAAVDRIKEGVSASKLVIELP